MRNVIPDSDVYSIIIKMNFNDAIATSVFPQNFKTEI